MIILLFAFILIVQVVLVKLLFIRLYIIYFKNQTKVASTMTFTGIAATLLPNGKTIHKVFGLPVSLFANSTLNVNPLTHQLKIRKRSFFRQFFYFLFSLLHKDTLTNFCYFYLYVIFIYIWNQNSRSHVLLGYAKKIQILAPELSRLNTLRS